MLTYPHIGRKVEILISQDFNMLKKKIQIVFSSLCGSAHSFDLEASEPHT